MGEGLGVRALSEVLSFFAPQCHPAVMEKPELLPCPFCGGKAESETWTDNDYYVPAVFCTECGAKILADGKTFQKGRTSNEAIKWNRRVPSREQRIWNEIGPSPDVVEPKRKRKN